MELEPNDQSSVNIRMLFRNISLIGYSKAKCVKATGFKKNPQGNKLEIVTNMNKLYLIGPYNVKGKILVLPIIGEN